MIVSIREITRKTSTESLTEIRNKWITMEQAYVISNEVRSPKILDIHRSSCFLLKSILASSNVIPFLKLDLIFDDNRMKNHRC